MKYLIMTEGTCEQAFIEVLIEKNVLSISIESLLYERVFHARQIKGSLIEMINQLPVSEKITIIRIGDKLSDNLMIPLEVEDRIEQCLKVCIKPEFELLHLIYIKEASKYIKNYKSSKKPSEYLYDIDCTYEKSYEYNYSFFNKISKDGLISIIKKYTTLRRNVHKKDELMLEDLMNKDFYLNKK